MFLGPRAQDQEIDPIYQCQCWPEKLAREQGMSVSSGLGLYAPVSWRIQISSATIDLKAAISSAMASAGVLHPRVFLGRLFMRFATSFSRV